MAATIPCRPLLCFIVTVFLLSGCGGGGGSASSNTPPPSPTPRIELLTGTTGGYGYFDGTGSFAQFASPWGIAVDRSENLYVADAGNGVIRKVTPQGVTTTLAGAARQSGYVDGPGAQARFGFGIGGNFGPLGVAVDAAANVYVADTLNHVIRKISAAGMVSTVAGNGEKGSADGQGSAARFSFPSAIAVDPSGNLYVADTGNHTIRRITTDGMVTTVAGSAGLVGDADGPALDARFTSPQSIAVGIAGDVYIVAKGAIRKLSADGRVTTFIAAATAPEGQALDASAMSGQGSATDAAGNIYATDLLTVSIRKITPGGAVMTLAGRKGFACPRNGPVDSALFWSIAHIAVAPSGMVYVTEGNPSVIRAISPGREVTTLVGLEPRCMLGDGTLEGAAFQSITDIAVDGTGKVFVVDGSARTVRTISNGLVATLPAEFRPYQYLAPGSSGEVYVIGFQYPGICRFGCDWKAFGELVRISPGGLTSPITPTTSSDGTGVEINAAGGLARDALGALYWTDPDFHTVRKLSPGGDLTTLAGKTRTSGSANGLGSAARFNGPGGLVLDNAGNLYVADIQNHAIRRITPQGDVTTFAGSPGEPGTVDGPRATARFTTPRYLALDNDGNLYVLEQGTCLVRKIGTSGLVTTIAGTVGQCGFAPGALPGAVPAGPIAVFGSDLYIGMGAGIAVVRNRP